MSAPMLASPADKRYELRRLVETMTELGVPLADVPSPATLAGEHDRLFVTRDHIRVIDEALVWLAATPGGRLMVNIPPQLGKSTLVSRWFPFWWFLQRPMDRIVLTSYASSLAAGHSAACRDLIADFGGEYGLSLSPTESNRTDWTLTTGGGLRARGVRGGLTGNPMDCLTGDTAILTPQGAMTIAEIVAAETPPKVLSHNHSTGRNEWRPVVATRTIRDRPVVEVLTAHGRRIRCTADHRIYIPGRGYVPARDLRAGEPIAVAGDIPVRTMRGGRNPEAERGSEGRGEEREQSLLRDGLLPSNQTGPDDFLRVCALRHHVHSAGVRVRQEASQGDHESVLLPDVYGVRVRSAERTSLQDVRREDGPRAQPVVLLGSVPHDRQIREQEGHTAEPDIDVPGVRRDVPSEVVAHGVLRPPVRGPRSLEAHDRARELAVHDREELRELVPGDASADPRPRGESVHAVWSDAATAEVHAEREASASVADARAPHQRGSGGQPGGESGGAVCVLPREAPSPRADSVVGVREVRGERHTVYDLQVEGNRNFFAGEVLVHNCGIIDDPLADRAQADSPVYRAAVWEWYSSVFLSRMSPGARQVVIMTRWHQDDLSGRLLKRDGRLEDGGLWKVVHLPAIAVAEDRERGFYADPMGRAPGDPLPHPKIAAGDRGAAMAFWTRRRADSTSRDWNALYQGVPHDTEGSLLSDLDVLRATVHQVPALRRIAVGVDPSGGGRDEAGLVAGGLGADGRVYLTRNLTGRMTSDRWASAACLLAVDVGADRIVVEKNFGGDMARLLILQAWDNLVRDGKVAGLPPMVSEVTARRSKVLRAEPIAQAIKGRPDADEPGRVRFADAHELNALKAEFTMWTPGSTWSPGALDASVHLVTELLPSLPGGARIASPTGIRRGEARGGGPRIERRA